MIMVRVADADGTTRTKRARGPDVKAGAPNRQNAGRLRRETRASDHAGAVIDRTSRRVLAAIEQSFPYSEECRAPRVRDGFRWPGLLGDTMRPWNVSGDA